MNRREFAAGASLVVGAVAVGLLAALISLLGSRTRFEPVPVGDQLGQDNGETFAEYVERADASLDDAPGDAPVFALVTFAVEASPDEASAALESVNSVDAVIPPDAPLQPVGEPKEGRDRTDIFRIAVDGDVVGAVVRDTGDALRALSSNERIATVEALPPDAVWGAFGVRPVNIQAP